MRRDFPSPRLTVVAALGVAMAALGTAQAQTVPRRYVIQTELAAPAAAPNAQGSKLNGQGMVVGGGVVVDGTRTRLAFIGGKLRWVTSPVERSVGVTWVGGQPTVLKSYATQSSADTAAVNDAGWVVGQATKTGAVDAPLYATLWKSASPTDLGAGVDSYADAINQQGWVLGNRYVTVKVNGYSVPTSEPFVWRQGRLERLNAYPGGVVGMSCRGLSDAGVSACAGTAFDPATYSTTRKTFIRAHGVYQPLDYEGAQDLRFAGVSRDGLVSGNLTLNGELRAFVWRDGQFTLLPRAGFTVLAPTTQGLMRAYRRFLTPESPYVHQEEHQLWSLSGDAVNVRELVVASGESVVAVADLNDQGQLLAGVRRPTDLPGTPARMVVLSPAAP